LDGARSREAIVQCVLNYITNDRSCALTPITPLLLLIPDFGALFISSLFPIITALVAMIFGVPLGRGCCFGPSSASLRLASASAGTVWGGWAGMSNW
jgi:hypothetical protein